MNKEQQQLLKTAGNLIDAKCTRDILVPVYIAMMQSVTTYGELDCFKPLNELILARWSPSGLDYIKRKSWKALK